MVFSFTLSVCFICSSVSPSCATISSGRVAEKICEVLGLSLLIPGDVYGGLIFGAGARVERHVVDKQWN